MPHNYRNPRPSLRCHARSQTTLLLRPNSRHHRRRILRGPLCGHTLVPSCHRNPRRELPPKRSPLREQRHLNPSPHVDGRAAAHSSITMPNRSAFTVIELLVVIAMIAILSIVVILTLNPAALLQQSRDSNRVSDMSTLNTALGVYLAQGGSSLGSSSVVYVSIPDPTATTTAGDQCQGLASEVPPGGLASMTLAACATQMSLSRGEIDFKSQISCDVSG
jgi:type II secretory pathway pseudopilin PulG